MPQQSEQAKQKIEQAVQELTPKEELRNLENKVNAEAEKNNVLETQIKDLVKTSFTAEKIMTKEEKQNVFKSVKGELAKESGGEKAANNIMEEFGINTLENLMQRIAPVSLETYAGGSNIKEPEIKKEAEKFIQENMKKQKTAEVRNKAEALLSRSENTLKEAGDKVSEEIKKPVNEEIHALKELLKNKDLSLKDLQAGYDALSSETRKLDSKMNQPSKSTAEAAIPGTENPAAVQEAAAGPRENEIKPPEKKGEEDNPFEAEVMK